MDLFDNISWNTHSEEYQHGLSLQMSTQEHQMIAGLVQPQPIIQVEGTIQTPTLSEYDYGGLSACASPYLSSPSAESNRKRYSFGSYDRWTPYTPFMSPIITTTRSHSVKRNKRPSSYSRWTLEEDELLRQAVQLHGPHKWSLIASHIPNRTPMQCSTRWLGALNPKIHKGRWTEEEDNILRYSVLEYANITDSEGRLQPIPWNKIAERIPNRTGIQCQARWTEALDPYVRKGKWDIEEDTLLRMGVNDFGKCWIRIAETIPGRTQRQCRTRWMQIKYKEDRQQKAEQKRKIINDDISSQSCISSDDEEEEVQKKQKEQDMSTFFIVDDFDTQLNAANAAGTTANLDFFTKSDDDFFLSTDWAYQL